MSDTNATRLGATVRPDDRTRFLVWAPDATEVTVVIDDDPYPGTVHEPDVCLLPERDDR